MMLRSPLRPVLRSPLRSPFGFDGTAVWSPLDVFAGGEDGGWWDASALGTVFQLTDGSIPSLPGDPVGLWLDGTENDINLSQTTAAARPTYGRVPVTGRRNLLTWTEDFGNAAAWGGATQVTRTPVEDGWWLLDKTVIGQWGVAQNIGNISNDQTVTLTVDFKSPPDPGAGIFNFGLYRGNWGEDVDNTGEILSGPGVLTRAQGALWRITGLSETEPTKVAVSRTARSTDALTAVTFNTYIGGTIGSSPLLKIYIRYPQIESGSEPTPYQAVTNAFDVTEAGVPDTYDLTYDLTDDALTTTFPSTVTGDILIAGRNGSIIEPFTGNTLTIGPTSYTGGTPGILSAIGGIVGVLVIDRSLTQVEKDQLIAYYKGKGAGDLL